MQGMLLVDKPAGWTSFDVVNYVRKIIANAEGQKPKHVKVGHTGTLDPFATGLLVLLIGKEYTRRAGELSKLDKTYEVTMRLGQTSTTGDPEGEITRYRTGADIPSVAEESRSKKSQKSHEKENGISRQARDDGAISDTAPTLEALQGAVERFRGQILQIPPAYSAIKVNGQRAYKLARAGKAVVIEPRQVTIHHLEIANYTYPEVSLVAEVSSGTYIRTLSEDIGSILGTGAYTTGLRRTAIGNYALKQAIPVATLNPAELAKYLTGL